MTMPRVKKRCVSRNAMTGMTRVISVPAWEASVLEAQDVRDAFQRHGIVKLKADWTNGDPLITKLLQQFGRPGVPLYVLYPAKNEEPIVFPEVLTKSMVIDKLETVARRVASQY